MSDEETVLPVLLTRELSNLGLTPRQTANLLPETLRLSPFLQKLALALARRSGKRAAETLRTVLDISTNWPDSPEYLSLLHESQVSLNASLAILHRLPELVACLKKEGLKEWLALIGRQPEAIQTELAERSLGPLISLGDAVSAKLALNLTRIWEQSGEPILDAFRLSLWAAAVYQKPRLLLGLALRLAKINPRAAWNWLNAWEAGPASRLKAKDLGRWFAAGIKLQSKAGDYFKPESAQALALADDIAGSFTLKRASAWLAAYASLHAGRSLKLKYIHSSDPTLPAFDLEDADSLVLPDRLEPGQYKQTSLVRSLAALGATSRRLGFFELRLGEVEILLERLDLKPPALHELAPPGLFFASFPSPAWARLLLGLALEAWLVDHCRRHLPGLARDLANLHQARTQTFRAWPALDPGRRTILLAAHFLAGGSHPAQILPHEYESAAEIATLLRREAPESTALSLLELTARLYCLLPQGQLSMQKDQSKADGLIASQEPGRIFSKKGEPFTPLSTMQGKEPPGPNYGWPGGSPGEQSQALNATAYPEWDPVQGRLVPGRTLVLERRSAEADAHGLKAALKEKAGLAKRVERIFISLAPLERQAQGRCPDGPELDLGALVEEQVEAQAGLSPLGLIYKRPSPVRRQVSCGVLWDVSGSTKHGLNHTRPGLDVIGASRLALALFARALALAGDEFALWAYSGVGARRVDFYTIKDFEQPLNETVYRRLCAQRPLAQNRDGAALRHAISRLAIRPNRRRIMLIITDGRPDDYGYGPEVTEGDLPRALAQARIAGIRPVAVLLTPQGRTPHRAYRSIAHLLLRDLDTLPQRLPALYRRLTT